MLVDNLLTKHALLISRKNSRYCLTSSCLYSCKHPHSVQFRVGRVFLLYETGCDYYDSGQRYQDTEYVGEGLLGGGGIFVYTGQ